MDAFGHVHHIAVVAIAEHARSRWLDTVLDAEETWPYVVARIAFDYRSPLLWEERFARVEIAARRVGTSSITLRESLLAPDGREVAEGECVVVAWDVADARSRPLSPDERDRLARFAPA